MRRIEEAFGELQPLLEVRLSSLLPGAEIRSTADGSDPGLGSPLYEGPIELPVDETGTRVTARVYLESVTHHPGFGVLPINPVCT